MANGLYNRGSVLIDGYPIDISITEDHVYDSDITDFPVETGADITDNIRPKPITVSFEGIVSDTPLLKSGAANVAVNQNAPTGDDDLPQIDAYLRLLKIRNDRKPVQIATSLDLFNNMALKTLTIPRTAANSNSLHFKVTFVQITQVEVTRVSVPIATPAHQGSGNPYLTTGFIQLDYTQMAWYDEAAGLWWRSFQEHPDIDGPHWLLYRYSVTNGPKPIGPQNADLPAFVGEVAAGLRVELDNVVSVPAVDCSFPVNLKQTGTIPGFHA